MSCWSCAHQQLAGETFLGSCAFFTLKGLAPKEIPAAVVDAGCKFKENKING
jgi:hypothetical protein